MAAAVIKIIPKTKMLGLVCKFDKEDKQYGGQTVTMWVPMENLCGLNTSDYHILENSLVTDIQTEEVKGRTGRIVRLVEGKIMDEFGEEVIAEVRSPLSTGTANDTQPLDKPVKREKDAEKVEKKDAGRIDNGNGRRQRSNERGQKRDQQSNEQDRITGGYVVVEDYELKKRSIFVKGTHVKGRQRQEIEFYLRRSTFEQLESSNLLDQLKKGKAIIVGVELEKVQKGDTTFVVLRRGDFRADGKSYHYSTELSEEAEETEKNQKRANRKRR